MPSDLRARRRTLELKEYRPSLFPATEISDELGVHINTAWGKYVAVDFPSLGNGHQWQLTPGSWAGYLPVSRELGILLQPKVEVRNIFRMFEYAYRLQSLHVINDLIDCDSLEDFYSRLAEILARRVLDRCRRGLYRGYTPQEETLPYLRGHVDMARLAAEPWRVNLDCRYEEHTSDVEENQILAWTLNTIAKSGACNHRVLPLVRNAWRATHNAATLRPFSASECIGRLYNRLNEDYEPLHLLCRFFIEHSGPAQARGDREIIPFVVDMARLFELFVAEWLKAHLGKRYAVRSQDRVTLGEQSQIYFNIDMVLHDRDTARDICVMDAKYKGAEHPESSDVSQILSYAHMKQCHDAILVYPHPITGAFDTYSRDIRVRTAHFTLADDLEKNGQELMRQILEV